MRGRPYIVKSWIKQHLQVFFYTLGQFSRNRLNISMTLLALGIGFSIPLIMYSVVDSISRIGGQWQERPQITLYLARETQQAQIESLQAILEEDARLETIQYISAEAGLKELGAQFQFEQALALLDENPLPPVFVVFPGAADEVEAISRLTADLGRLPHVASAQYDFEWLQKLSALTEFLKRIVILLAIIIAVGILLLITNTIRLEIANRKEEIEIIDQLGGSSAFISRPFLYMGFLEGFLGGLVAILISPSVLKLLNAPLLRLAELYGFAFELPLARPDISLMVLLVSGLLGWISARFTVFQHLRLLAPV